MTPQNTQFFALALRQLGFPVNDHHAAAIAEAYELVHEMQGRVTLADLAPAYAKMQGEIVKQEIVSIASENARAANRGWSVG